MFASELTALSPEPDAPRFQRRAARFVTLRDSQPYFAVARPEASSLAGLPLLFRIAGEELPAEIECL